ncbi:MAG: hypothetical protein MI975_04170 [Cytophagales bacterium]|nr:hypothetical protein [Cytophagales bacterium]
MLLPDHSFDRAALRSLFFMIYFIGSGDASGQALNDDIEHRIPLFLNSAVRSSTANCTLQWECLDHKQTKKCIQYHNDQWFAISLTDQDKYYLNIYNQKCRDLRGVQLLIIDGVPCQPETYHILKCVSLGNHDDIFITLDDLERDREYLLLVDGYLHDFCEFHLEFSDEPKGIPFTVNHAVVLRSNLIGDRHLEIYWSVPDSLATTFSRYEVYRRHENSFKSEKVHDIEQGLNAFGAPKMNYFVEEYLPDFGTYFYKIIGTNEDERLVISEQQVFAPRLKNTGLDRSEWLELELFYTIAGKLKISVYDAATHRLLYWTNFNYSRQTKLFEINVKEYMDEGIFFFRILVEHQETGEKKNHLIHMK